MHILHIYIIYIFILFFYLHVFNMLCCLGGSP